MKEIFEDGIEPLARLYCKACYKSHWVDFIKSNRFGEEEYIIEFKDDSNNDHLGLMSRYQTWLRRFKNLNSSSAIHSVMASRLQIEKLVSVFIDEFRVPNTDTNWKFIPWNVSTSHTDSYWVEAIIFRSKDGLNVSFEGFYERGAINNVEIVFSFTDAALLKNRDYFKRVSRNFIFGGYYEPFVEDSTFISKDEMLELTKRLIKVSKMINSVNLENGGIDSIPWQ